MTENEENNSNKFLQGVLSQPGLKEKFNRGFASRNITDKFLFNDIVQYSSHIQPTSSQISKESCSKVDRIIDDFLDKIRKRNIDTKVPSFSMNRHESEHETPLFYSQKRMKFDSGPSRYFKNPSPEYKEINKYNIFASNSRQSKNPREKDKYNFSDAIVNNDIKIPKLSFVLKNSEKPNFNTRNFHDKSFVDLDDSSNLNNSQIYCNNASTNKFHGGKYINIPSNSMEHENVLERYSRSPNKPDQEFKFDCDFISPIENCESKMIIDSHKPNKCIYPPNAFSTPKYKYCNPHLMSLVKQNTSPSSKSVGTQTKCSHTCLVCSSSPIKNQFIKPGYFYEE